MPRVLRRNAPFRSALLADEIKTVLGAEDERRSGKNSGHHAIPCDHADGLAAVTHWQTGAWIENVSIASAVDDERAEIGAGGGDSMVSHTHRGPTFARPVRFFQTDVPRILTR